MNNRSKVYGYYGGVTKENFYTPPESPNFVPQPPKVALTEADKQALLAAAASLEFYNENSPNIMLRTVENAGTVDTFTITTSANPDDKIIYTTDETVSRGVNLNVVDGGYV